MGCWRQLLSFCLLPNAGHLVLLQLLQDEQHLSWPSFAPMPLQHRLLLDDKGKKQREVLGAFEIVARGAIWTL